MHVLGMRDAGGRCPSCGVVWWEFELYHARERLQQPCKTCASAVGDIGRAQAGSDKLRERIAELEREIDFLHSEAESAGRNGSNGGLQ